MFKVMQVFFIASCFLLSGCVVRTYKLTKERVDQDFSGNRGYLKGEAGPEEQGERKTTRTTQVVEIELHSPLRFEKMPKQGVVVEPQLRQREDTGLSGNRGYLFQSETPEAIVIEAPLNIKEYTVQKGDTLQKISKKFYGTTKKWNKIYQANKDTLKGPNKVYPGQVLDIPTEGLKEPKENLK